MSDYQLHSEDEHAYTILDPSGKTFLVAKAGLQKGIHSKIKKMAEGGIVGNKKIASNDDISFIPQALGLDPESLQARFERDQAMLPKENIPVDNTTGIKRDLASASNQNLNPSSITSTNPTLTSPGLSDSVGGGAGTPTTTDSTDPFQNLQSKYSANEKQMLEGIQGVANAQAKQARDSANAYSIADIKRDVIAQDFAQKKQALDQEYEQRFKDYNEGKINPTSVYDNMSTGNKVLAGISIALSGIGSGLSGQPNIALKMLDDFVNRDIEAQKVDINKKGTLLHMNMQKYRDVVAAESATYLDMNTALQAQIAKAAAQNGSQIALNQAKIMMGELKDKRAPHEMQLLERKMVSQLASGSGNASAMNLEYLSPEVRERVVTVSNKDGRPQYAMARTKEDATKFKEAKDGLDVLGTEIDELIELRKELGVSPNPMGTDNSRLRSSQASIITSLGKLHGLSTLNNNELKEFHEMVPSPYEPNDERALAKLMHLKHLVNLNVSKKANNFLINYNPGNIKESAPIK